MTRNPLRIFPLGHSDINHTSSYRCRVAGGAKRVLRYIHLALLPASDQIHDRGELALRNLPESQRRFGPCAAPAA